MKMHNLEDVLTDEIRDIYSLEQQLIKALPLMARAVDGDLRTTFEDHLEQTRVHADRIQQICEMMQINPDGRKCTGIEGIVKEGRQVIKSKAAPDSLSAALIGNAQRVEHYEIAAYGTARTHARQLGFINMVDLLNKTLDEEKQCDWKLTKLAESNINVKAAMESPRHDAGAGMQM